MQKIFFSFLFFPSLCFSQITLSSSAGVGGISNPTATNIVRAVATEDGYITNIVSTTGFSTWVKTNGTQYMTMTNASMSIFAPIVAATIPNVNSVIGKAPLMIVGPSATNIAFISIPSSIGTNLLCVWRGSTDSVAKGYIQVRVNGDSVNTHAGYIYFNGANAEGAGETGTGMGLGIIDGTNRVNCSGWFILVAHPSLTGLNVCSFMASSEPWVSRQYWGNSFYRGAETVLNYYYMFSDAGAFFTNFVLYVYGL